jgi:peptidoglycan/LPS O-acetylase OafA/YrhL
MDGRCSNRQPDLWKQIVQMCLNFAAMMNPFTWSEYYPPGVPQLWTLSMEFRGSMVVFMLILCLGNTKPVLRIIFLLFFSYYCLHMAHWDVSLFVCGIALAELRILRNQTIYSIDCVNTSVKLRLQSTIEVAKSLFWITILVLALFIGSWPAYGAASSPGFQTLCFYTPTTYSNELLEEYFWISVAAFLLLLSFENFKPLQKPFVTPLAMYAGDISFGFYIVHWPLLLTMGRLIIPEMTRIISKEGVDTGFGSYTLGWWIGVIVLTPIVVWVADCHWRGIDIQAVKLTRWLADICFEPSSRRELLIVATR